MRRWLGLAVIRRNDGVRLSAAAEETEYDPAKVSDSLKAIFQFGSAATKQALNENTVTLHHRHHRRHLCADRRRPRFGAR